MNKEQFVKTLNDYLLAHGYARWESWDINFEWERYQRGRSWSNEFFAQAEIQASVDAAYEAMSEEERAAMWKEDAEDARRNAHEPEMNHGAIDFTDMKCQEASPFTPGFYTPCGMQASAVVWHQKDRRAYLMCFGCTYHNVRNRGGKLIAQEL